ncbi:MAG: hypothetical protein V4517_09185 [Pseudomonadota bacterium]
MTIESTDDAIELRVDEIAQLFHTLDPSPFRERDLDREAAEFIVGWARELHTDQPIRIIVHFPESELQNKAAQDLAEAIRGYFSHRATMLQRDLTELFRVGRRSLGIGMMVLIACFAMARFASGFVEGSLSRMIEESFLILGWVANWRPLEIFLYDWWPIVRRRDLYRRLSSALVEARSFPAP